MRRIRAPHRGAGVAVAALFFILFAQESFAKVKITINNKNAAGIGFNDPTPAAPVGGNPGTTIGQQRLNAFQRAADIWSTLLESNAEIVVDAEFIPLDCTEGRIVLGSAGATSLFADFGGAPRSGVWYPVALANKFAGRDLNGATGEIFAQFNSELGKENCAPNSGWYLGFDGNHGAMEDLVPTLLHEIAHGLGFAATYNRTSGELSQGRPGMFEINMVDATTGVSWDQMSSQERLVSRINNQNLLWSGTTANGAAAKLLTGAATFRVISPASIAAGYAIGTASFGGKFTVAGIASNVVQAQDVAEPADPSTNTVAGTTSDGCSAFTNAGAMIGQIALIDRGRCRFVEKAKNAQNAGAVAVVIVDNVTAETPPGMSGSDPTVTIPVISVTRSVGESIRAQLGGGVSANLFADAANLAGMNMARGFMKLYAPTTFSAGSSVSHWDNTAMPNLLMEPASNGDETHDVDITIDQLVDIGWVRATTGSSTPVPGRRSLRRGKP